MKIQNMLRSVFLIFLCCLAFGCGESTAPSDGSEDSTMDLEIHLVDEITGDPADGIDIRIEPVGDPTDIPFTDIVATTPIGEACETEFECITPDGVGQLCLGDLVVIAFPNGYCSGDCSLVEDCGPGGTCVDMSLGKVCMKPCATSDDCRVDEGYRCDIIPFITDANTYCIPDINI